MGSTEVGTGAVAVLSSLAPTTGPRAQDRCAGSRSGSTAEAGWDEGRETLAHPASWPAAPATATRPVDSPNLHKKRGRTQFAVSPDRRDRISRDPGQSRRHSRWHKAGVPAHSEAPEPTQRQLTITGPSAMDATFRAIKAGLGTSRPSKDARSAHASTEIRVFILMVL